MEFLKSKIALKLAAIYFVFVMIICMGSFFADSFNFKSSYCNDPYRRPIGINCDDRSLLGFAESFLPFIFPAYVILSLVIYGHVPNFSFLEDNSGNMYLFFIIVINVIFIYLFFAVTFSIFKNRKQRVIN